MKYPLAGDLQKGMSNTLTANPTRDYRFYESMVNAATRWARSPSYPFNPPQFEKYIQIVPEGGDVGFWLGEVMNHIKYDAKQDLDPQDYRELERYIQAETFRIDASNLHGKHLGAKVQLNPSEIFEEDAEAAVEKFTEFHRFDPKRLEEIEGLMIPSRVRKLGAAKHVMYRSDKVDPSTLKKPKRPVDYIHEHDAGVTVYSTLGTPDTDVPKSIRDTTALVRLGKCLGFALRDGGEAEGTTPLPDLCCTPDGKCLLVVQDKKKVLAMFWGGALGVFARGIDG